jgi:homoserine O-acetyltransferase
LNAKKPFAGSDAVRTGSPLKHLKTQTYREPFALESGATLPELTVAYETYGTLNDRRDNAVLICHALSGDSHVARHDPSDDPGWWDLMVGPGRPIDTDRYFVICNNCLGGCRGTTGPNSMNPATGKPYGRGFPTVTIGDMVEVQRKLIASLGIEKLLAVVGGSMGGHQVLTWATRHSEQVGGAVALATSPRVSSQALAFDIVGRNAIFQDPHFQQGQYYDKPAKPDVGLAIARMIGHITYLSREAMREKFEPDRLKPRDVPVEFEKKFSVGSYLGYQGAKFVERFDANSYVTVSMAMDLFDLGATPEELRRNMARSTCRWLVVSFTSDWLFSPAESRQLVDALIACEKDVSYCNVQAGGGHDSFLLEEALDSYGGLTEAFLSNLDGHDKGYESSQQAPHAHPASIFQTGRIDYDQILELIEPGSSVLDLGCGGGQLLAELRRQGHRNICGVEVDESALLEAVRRGLNIVQADLNAGLGAYRENQFDTVVLSHTLQAVYDVPRVLDHMLRVGRQCIVTFPNFAYKKLRDTLYHQGRAPSSGGLLRYPWYDTPNIRFCSILDFQEYCSQRGIGIHRLIGLDTERGSQIAQEEDVNLRADMAVVVLSR